MKKKLLLQSALAIGLIVLLGVGLAMYLARGSLSTARELAKVQLWPQVQKELDRYLWWYPRDGEARLLMADSLLKDTTLPREQAVEQALDHLDRVSDDSSHGAAARIAAGQIELHLRLKPGRAERLFRRAIELEPNAAEMHYLLWMLMDLVGRQDLAEPAFWKTYDLTPEEGRAACLREWYISQFYPVAANVAFERMMDLSGDKPRPTTNTEASRCIQFSGTEPDDALIHAAVARWFIAGGNPKFALKLLDEAANQVDGHREHPHYAATRIEALIALGEFNQAGTCFDTWPEPHSGHEYWKWRAVVLDEVRGQYDEALEAYDLALSAWPGAANWGLRFRKAHCLAHAGDHRAAEAERAAANALEKLTREDVQERIREALGNLRNPVGLESVADFYEKLGRPREAACWRMEIERLQAPTPPRISPDGRES